MDNKGIELIKDLLSELVINIEECGPCDHSVNVCVCAWVNLREKTENYLQSLEKTKITTSEAWQKIVGNEHIKRAIEVSLAGQHPITIIGNPDNGEEYFEIILGDLLSFVKQCPCGGFMEYNKECTCTKSKIEKYRTSKEFQKSLKNPIIIRLFPPTMFDYQGKEGESFRDVMNRINRKMDRSYPAPALDKPSLYLLNTAIERLGLSLLQVKHIENVRKTIAELANSDTILSHHLSEAIQYQNIDRNS